MSPVADRSNGQRTESAWRAVPVVDPNSLNVRDLLPLLSELSQDELHDVFDREVVGRNRASVVHRIDELLARSAPPEVAGADPDSVAPAPVAPATATCRLCGALIEPEDAFCRACGVSAVVSAADVPQPPTAPKGPGGTQRRRARAVLVTVVVALLALAMFGYTEVGDGLGRWASAVVVGACVLAVIGMAMVRRLVHRRNHDPENDAVGWLFSGVAVVNAVLLAFVVFAVYERYSALRQTVTEEAAALVVSYRDTELLPEPARSEAQRVIRSYTRVVMSNEWQSHGLVKPHSTPDALNPVWRAYRSVSPQNTDIESRLHDLERQRHLRHLASENSLPGVFWPLLVLGAAATVIASFFFSMKRAWVQAVLTVSLAAILVGTVLLISSLNRPFTGPSPISRSPFQHALLNFDALDK